MQIATDKVDPGCLCLMLLANSRHRKNTHTFSRIKRTSIIFRFLFHCNRYELAMSHTLGNPTLHCNCYELAISHAFGNPTLHCNRYELAMSHTLGNPTL